MLNILLFHILCGRLSAFIAQILQRGAKVKHEKVRVHPESCSNLEPKESKQCLADDYQIFSLLI